MAILFAVALVVAVGQRPAFAAAPVTQPDAYSTPAGTTLKVAAPGVLANDTDPDGDPLTAGMPTNPSHGTLVVLSETGAFTYTPAAGFTGTDSFTYMAHDGTGGMTTGTVTITVGSGGGGGGGTSPALSVSNVSVTEGSDGVTKTAVFKVTRTGDTTGTSTVKYSTANGTATAGSDYTAINNKTLTFAAGVTVMKVKVKVTGDNVKEANETFSVVLSSPTGATISHGTGVGTIVDND
ncbi:MAG TPA: Ig-like domain-containing protein [Acidimicrobiales bacterium]|jgi:hypothetical protein|nr:Ig-like domain-containing protein [Acidimicrobiales bacterium]